MDKIRHRLYVVATILFGLALFAKSVLAHQLIWPQLAVAALAVGLLARNLRDDDPARRPWVAMLFCPRQTIRTLLDNNRRGSIHVLAALEGMALALSLSTGLFGDDPNQLYFARTLLSVLAFGALAGPIVLYLLSWSLAVVGRCIGGDAEPVHIRMALAWGAIPLAWSLLLKLPALVVLQGAVFTSDNNSVTSLSMVPAMALIINDLGSISAGLWGMIGIATSLNETQYFSGWRAYATFALTAVVLVTPDVLLLSIWQHTPLSPAVELRRRAERGDAVAQTALGGMYDEGRDVSLDDTEAVKWYRKAADQGYADAQYNLALMYLEGTGVAQDNIAAVRWLRKAAEQGQAASQLNLGVMYDRGQGVQQDAPEAVRWYRKAAEQGQLDAQTNLALMYDAGLGVPEDDVEAVRWYRKAAEQGNASAQSNLGSMYLAGTGVARDDHEAVEWFRKAADQGSAPAQRNLGLMYADGRGVGQSNDEAVKWMRKAADTPNDAQQQQFNPIRAEEIAETQNLAKQWLQQYDESTRPSTAPPSPTPSRPDRPSRRPRKRRPTTQIDLGKWTYTGSS